MKKLLIRNENYLLINKTMFCLFSMLLIGSVGFSQPYNVVWRNLVGVTVAGNTITKNGTEGWNAGASSTYRLNASTNGWVEMVAGGTTTNRMFGFSQSDPNTDYATILYGVYPAADGKIYVYEGGSNVYNGLTTYTSTDVIRVERVGNIISYKVNSTIFYTSLTPNSNSLIVDATIWSTNGTLANVIVNFNTLDPTCSDGIQNGTETGVDCGGTCPTACPVGGTSQWTTVGTSGIYYSNNVHIGKPNTATGPETPGYSLYIKNGIKSEKVKIELASTGLWGDYVFKNDYRLLPIKEVERFIKAHHHLPGFPSEASIIKEGGFEMGDMIKRQQVGIESLYLYIIELKKENKELSDRLKEIEIFLNKK